MNLAQFDDLDVKILSGVLSKQVVRWDETWGSAAWRRENKVTTASKFWQDQKMTRDRAAKLSRMFREEQKHRESRTGLCGNREDHDSHRHESTSLGAFWCHADQTKRLPYAMERRNER